MNSNAPEHSASLKSLRFRVNPTAFTEARRLFDKVGIKTVCEGAKCPNRGECYSQGTASVMILGGNCTRNCRFCSVPNAKPQPIDPSEPEKVSALVNLLGMKHIVVTSPTRDDLEDGGASAFVAVAEKIAKGGDRPRMEALIPDFGGNMASVGKAACSEFDVLGHNLETVCRLYGKVRPGADYETSLLILKEMKRLAPGKQIRSAIMLGLGETDEEAAEALRDLRRAGVDVVSIGQYLRPTSRQLPVSRILSQRDFENWKNFADELGFSQTYSGPRVRSSYASYSKSQTQHT